MSAFITVAVPLPLDPLTYRVSGPVPPRGARVVVPLGRRTVTGCVLGIADTPGPHVVVRDTLDVLDDEPYVPEEVLALAAFIADYYICSFGDALSAAVPPFAWLSSRARLRATEAGRTPPTAVGPEQAIEQPLLEWTTDRACTEDGLVRRALRWAAVTPEGRRWAGAAGAAGGAAARRARLQAAVRRTVRRLERGGLLDRTQQARPPSVGEKTIKVTMVTASGLDAAVDAALTERQREALAALRRASEGLTTREAVAGGSSATVLAGLVRRGLATPGVRRIERDPFLADGPRRGVAEREAEKAGVALTGEQSSVLQQCMALAGAGRFRAVVLHGVTGSGKTEVYRRLAAHVREHGRTVLILVPEIALTPAVAATFRHTFGDRVAIQHSGLSAGERHDQWHRIRRGAVDVVVGTRSAVFAPLARLGLVIVDEEHDTSYKQEDAPRYHGRDVALVRARDAQALVVLGSATPALETFQNSVAGRYERLTMERRVLERPLADVQVVDMREEYAAEGPDVILSRRLHTALEQRLSQGEQAIVLLNRRGYAAAVVCRQCGGTLECPNCSVSLTVHFAARQARCHYCDHAVRVPESCGACGAPYVEYVGIGTERVEAEIVRRFPGVRVARVDRDTIRRRGAIVHVLDRFAAREVDVLVGTQMLAKGHDFPAVTLVGVISADVGLGLADFRAAERTFQLLTQVAGRAGRGDRRGEAIVQTLVPEHYSIRFARTQDYAGFFEAEAAFRRGLRYPPFVSMINLVVTGRTAREAVGDAGVLAADLRRIAPPAVTVLGPAVAPLQRLRGEHRAQCFLKSRDRRAMNTAVRRVLASRPGVARRVTVDVDPLTML